MEDTNRCVRKRDRHIRLTRKNVTATGEETDKIELQEHGRSNKYFIN